MAKKQATPFDSTDGQRLKAERLRRGWTLMDLAVEADSDPTMIWRCENDRAPIGRDLGERICAAFGWTSLSQLFGDVPQKDSQ